MDWVLRLTSSVVVLLLLVPFVVLLGGVILFGLVGHLLPRTLVKWRKTFDCPYSKQRAAVEFLSPPEAGQPSEVLSCSVFSNPYHVTCEKRCLTISEAGWTASPMMPRYSLLADGVAYRPAGSPHGPDSPGDMPRAA
jgi:hypothetical protein